MTVVPKTLVSIKAELVKETYNIGEELDIVITAFYDNNTTEVVTEYTVTGYDPNMTGVQTVTVTYQNKTCTFEVIVKQQDIENDEPYIEVLSEPEFNGGSLSGTVSVRTHNINESSKLILAVYDDKNILKTIQVKENDLSGSQVDFDELNITDMTDYSYAVFVWNDMISCKPLCAAYKSED